jgi:Zn-dependent peptidase ImmA (M78 family)
LAEFSADRGPLRVPVPIEEIAGWLGFQVIMLSAVDDACSALVSTQEKLIGINARHHAHRRRFSLGHEIAHVLLHHPPESRCSALQIAHFNAEADVCASELLIPDVLLRTWYARLRNGSALARVFDVSQEAMSLRLREAGLQSSQVPSGRSGGALHRRGSP